MLVLSLLILFLFLVLLLVLIVHILFQQFGGSRCVRFPLFLPQFILGKEDQQMLRSLYQFITKKSKQITFIGYKIVVADFLFQLLYFPTTDKRFSHIFHFQIAVVNIGKDG